MKLSSRYVLTDHAYTRIKERLRTNDEKLLKLVQKAWNSKSVHHKKLHKAEYKNWKPTHICKELMGYVFIFEIRGGKRVLITVY